MPRKSTAELAALKVVALDGKPPRLRPPPSLNEAERAVFIDLVAAAKSDHFVASDLPLLTRYCEAIVASRYSGRENHRRGRCEKRRTGRWRRAGCRWSSRTSQG